MGPVGLKGFMTPRLPYPRRPMHAQSVLDSAPRSDAIHFVLVLLSLLGGRDALLSSGDWHRESAPRQNIVSHIAPQAFSCS